MGDAALKKTRIGETHSVQYEQSRRLDNVSCTLDLKNTTKVAGSKGMSPDTVNGLALAASKGGR